ncbi:transposase [Brucella intermedia]|uniref:transposase n=1 Tax=Brucella intermedia TaxID=94625 RepID=UPI00396A719E
MGADTGEIIAEVLTDQNMSDISQLEALLERIDRPIASLTGDGAYDSDETYKTVRRHSPSASIIVPPRMRKFQDTS